MASEHRLSGLEDQLKKLVTVIDNGNRIQEQMEKRQSKIEERMQKGQEELNKLQDNIEERQSHIENKLDEVIQMINQGVKTKPDEVTTSFIADHVSIPLSSDVADWTETTVNQLPFHITDDTFTQHNTSGKFYTLY